MIRYHVEQITGNQYFLKVMVLKFGFYY